ncbi:MAG: toxin-antitoxin system HicB family antitoxin [Opitutaceae bacterium]|jgi:uncharacterized protein (DUF1778 family)|nr:toxin-antitoxin system HicB family antitoxin [Opitutaceae bacterium]
MSTITVRLPESIHGQVKELALVDGASINNFIVSAVAEKVAARRTVAWLKKQAAERGSAKRLLELLDQVPDVPPTPGDELPVKVRPKGSKK